MEFVIIKLDPYCVRLRRSLASQVSQGTGKQDPGEKEALVSDEWDLSTSIQSAIQSFRK